jgi:ElaA protein
MGDLDLHEATFDDLDTRTLYALLRLRVDVFVVEQACPYPELDGRDLEPTTAHVWLSGVDAAPVAYLRVKLGGADGARRIGRVVTHPAHRGEGLAARLIAHVLGTRPGPFVLDAQAHLVAWYEGFGFAVDGAPFVEDGIDHVPMRWDAEGQRST